MRNLSVKTCIRAGVTVVLVYLACTYWHTLVHWVSKALGAASPLLVGASVAYVANILMSFYEKHFFPHSQNRFICKCRRPLCLLLAFVTVVALIVWMVSILLPELIRCLELLGSYRSTALGDLYKWAESRPEVIQFLQGLLPEGTDASQSIDWQSVVKQFLSPVVEGVSGVLDIAVGLISSLFSFLITAFLTCVFAVYILLGKEKLGHQIRRVMRTYLGEKTSRRSLFVIDTLNQSFRSFIVGQTTEALILGTLCFLGMMVFGFDYALPISVMVGFLALIPIAGAYLAAAVGAFMLFMNSPMQALLFVVYLTVLQQIEGNLIFPRVVGSSIGLPAIWVLAAVTVGGGILDIPGMLLGVPIAATIYRLLGKDVSAREKGGTLFKATDAPADPPAPTT